MGLLDQLRLLDRALRDVRVREALRTGDRGGRRLARFAGSVAPADLAVLRAVDARRFEAVAQRQAELIRDRWWTPRFPATLIGAAKALGATTRDVALGTLASPAYDRREGADDTGSALLGYVLGREDRTNDPVWLSDLIAYEYMIAVGLPRRSKRESVDAALEARVFPEGTRFLEPQAKKPKASELALSKKVILLPLEFPVSQVREALLAGQDVEAEIDSEPHVLVFELEADAATEHPFPARAHDVLDMLAAAPLDGAKLLESFDPTDRVEVHGVVSALLDAGILSGPRPPEPAVVERAPEDEEPARGKKGGKKGAAPAKKAEARKPDARKPEAKAAASKPEPKKPEAKKPEAKKPEPKAVRPEPARAPAKKPAPPARAGKPAPQPARRAPVKPAPKKAPVKPAAASKAPGKAKAPSPAKAGRSAVPARSSAKKGAGAAGRGGGARPRGR